MIPPLLAQYEYIRSAPTRRDKMFSSGVLATSSASAANAASSPWAISGMFQTAASSVSAATDKASKGMSEATGLSESLCHSAIVGSAAVLSLVSTVVILTEHKRRRYPKQIPGKLGLPWLGSTPEFFTGCTEWLARSHEQYGDIFKAVIGGEQYVAVRGDELLQQTMASNKTDLLENGVLPGARILFGPQSLLSANHDLHKMLKRIFTKNMGPIPVQDYFPNVIPVLVERFKTWESTSGNPRYFNAFKVIKEAILHANLTLLLGTGAVPEEDIPLLSYQLHEYSKSILSLPIDVPGTTFHHGIQCANAVKARIRGLAEGRKGSKDGSALTLFVNYIDPDTNQPLPMEIIEQNLLIMLFASQDTTVAAFIKTIDALASRPDIVRKVREEWGCVDKPMDPEKFVKLTAADFLNKEYTRGVFMEAVRVQAPITFTIRKTTENLRLTTSKGLDVVLPTGMKILCSLDATMRTHTGVAGMDRAEFNPDRFTKENRAIMEQNKQYAFCGFGGELNK